MDLGKQFARPCYALQLLDGWWRQLSKLPHDSSEQHKRNSHATVTQVYGWFGAVSDTGMLACRLDATPQPSCSWMRLLD